MQDATIKELKQAVKLLYAAAGIQHLSLERSSNSSSAAAAGQPEFLTAASVRLVLHNDTVPHQGALKELIYVYREGEGAAQASASAPVPRAGIIRCWVFPLFGACLPSLQQQAAI
jgi:hypothetical protein